jgi:signal peptidase I
MQPWELLVLVAIIFVLRIILSLRPIVAQSNGKTTAFAREYLDPFIVAGLAAFLLISFIARTYYIPSGSMIPTLQIHDVLLVNKIEYRLHPPHQGDIAVFPPPIDPGGDDFIKRVIGVPGDTLRIDHGIVYRNGVALKEPYENAPPDYNLVIKNYGVYVDSDASGDYIPLDPTQANIPPRSQWTAPDRIPPHCYFMMGDNRNDSEDSHYWGFAQDSGTFATGPRAGQPAGYTGHAAFIFWPFNRAKLL